MVKNVYYGWLVVLVWNVLIANWVGAETPATNSSQPESSVMKLESNGSDFGGRMDAAVNLWQYVLNVLKSFNGEVENLSKTAKPQDKIDDFWDKAKQDPLVLLVITKYFSYDELQILSSFFNSAEMSSLIKKISNKIFSQDQQVSFDVKMLIEEMLNIYNLTMQPLGYPTTGQGTSSNALMTAALPSVAIDKVEAFKRGVAANEMIEALLPLLEQPIRRELNRRFVNMEKSKLSEAIKVMTRSLHENPVLVVILARHFDANELTKIANLLSTDEAQTLTENISRAITSRDEQFLRDFQLVFNAIEMPIERIKGMLQAPLSQMLATAVFPTTEKDNITPVSISTDKKGSRGSEGLKSEPNPPVSPTPNVNNKDAKKEGKDKKH